VSAAVRPASITVTITIMIIIITTAVAQLCRPSIRRRGQRTTGANTLARTLYVRL